MIYLPGGGQCYDQDSCDTRFISSKSSRYAPTTKDPNDVSILSTSPENTIFWGANKAYLLYCSSDGYMGNIGASEVYTDYYVDVLLTLKNMRIQYIL